MARDPRISTRRILFNTLGIAIVALVTAATGVGAAIAHADPNDPSMTKFSPDGRVRSEQSAGITVSDRCMANAGTLSTSDVRASDMGTPEQISKEAGPEWVGSRGWQAIALSPSNPWGGNFDPHTVSSGPVCSPVSPNGFS